MIALEEQIAAIVIAELQTVDAVNAMRERGIEPDHIAHWEQQIVALYAARETLRLLMVEREARQALAAHLGG
jgi:hypothetical protein